MSEKKLWTVTAKPNCPAIGGQVFKHVSGENAFDAKMNVVMREWKHPFTGLTDHMTAKREK